MTFIWNSTVVKLENASNFFFKKQIKKSLLSVTYILMVFLIYLTQIKVRFFKIMNFNAIWDTLLNTKCVENKGLCNQRPTSRTSGKNSISTHTTLRKSNQVQNFATRWHQIIKISIYVYQQLCKNQLFIQKNKEEHTK